MVHSSILEAGEESRAVVVGVPHGGRRPGNKKLGTLRANCTHFLHFQGIHPAPKNMRSLCCCVVLYFLSRTQTTFHQRPGRGSGEPTLCQRNLTLLPVFYFIFVQTQELPVSLKSFQGPHKIDTSVMGSDKAPLTHTVSNLPLPDLS